MKKIRIIICDNDEDELYYANEGFKKSGLFEVIQVVESGDDLIELLETMNKKDFPDLILSDLNMPGKNGYDLLALLGNDPQFADIPIYISSTAFSQLTMDKCSRLGAKDYIVKPDNFSRYDIFAISLYDKIMIEYPR